MLDNVIVPLLAFATALGLTLAIELPIAFLFKMGGDALKAFVLANIASNLLFNFFIFFIGASAMFGEIAVVVFEIAIVLYAARPENKVKVGLVILGANVASALTGYIIFTLLAGGF